MSTFYVFICTETTNERNIPVDGLPQGEFNRRVSLSFREFSTGAFNVGDCVIRTVSTPPPKHLLCDGSEVPKASFPQLYALIGDTEGTPTDADNFVLPNFVNSFVPAPTAPTQEVSAGGTVSTGDTVTTPSGSGQTGGTVGGNIPSGGRPIRDNFEV